MKNYLGADTVAHEQVPSERIGREEKTNEKWDQADNFGVTLANNMLNTHITAESKGWVESLKSGVVNRVTARSLLSYYGT